MFPTETHEQAKSGASSDSMARRNVHSDIRFSKDEGETSLGGKSGGDGAVGTPGPIPNPEVKHRSGEGIPGRGENSAPPGFFLLCPLPSVAGMGRWQLKTTGFQISVGTPMDV